MAKIDLKKKKRERWKRLDMLKRSLLSKAVDPQRRWGNLIFFLMSGKLLKTWATVCPCSGSSVVMLYMRSRSRLDNPPSPVSYKWHIFRPDIVKWCCLQADVWNSVGNTCGSVWWNVSLKFRRSLFLMEIKMSYLTYNPQYTHTHAECLVWIYHKDQNH